MLYLCNLNLTPGLDYFLFYATINSCEWIASSDKSKVYQRLIAVEYAPS